MNHPSTRRIYRATSLVVLFAFMMGCGVTKTYYVKRAHMEKATGVSTVPASMSARFKGKRVHIKRDAVSWSPKKAKKRCLHDIDKSADSSSCLELEEVTYTNNTARYMMLIGLAGMFFFSGVARAQGDTTASGVAGVFAVSSGIMVISAPLFWLMKAADPYPEQKAPSPGAPKDLHSSKGRSFGLGFQGTF